MKTMKIFITALFTFFAINAFSQNTEILKIKTSAQCGMCKTRIENSIIYERGVKDVSLDMDTKVLTVVIRKSRTNIKKIKTAINTLGYDADDSFANKLAYKKLPACCKKPEDRSINIKHGK